LSTAAAGPVLGGHAIPFDGLVITFGDALAVIKDGSEAFARISIMGMSEAFGGGEAIPCDGFGNILLSGAQAEVVAMAEGGLDAWAAGFGIGEKVLEFARASGMNEVEEEGGYDDEGPGMRMRFHARTFDRRGGRVEQQFSEKCPFRTAPVSPIPTWIVLTSAHE
jgi:hypothetical protein